MPCISTNRYSRATTRLRQHLQAHKFPGTIAWRHRVGGRRLAGNDTPAQHIVRTGRFHSRPRRRRDRSAEHLGIMVALGEIRHAVVGEAVARRAGRRLSESRRGNTHIVQPVPDVGRGTIRLHPSACAKRVARRVQENRTLPPPMQRIPRLTDSRGSTSATIIYLIFNFYLHFNIRLYNFTAIII